MIKDIVIHLPLGNTAKTAVVDYGLSIAGAFKAHIAGVAFVPEVFVPAPGYMPRQTIDLLRKESEAAAKSAVTQFSAAAARAGFEAETLTLDVGFADTGRSFGRVARCFDLVIVGQNDPDKRGADDIIVESALFDSGRPLVVVPYIQSAPLKLDNVMVCWDGSRTAARAVADAMPFLKRAGRVEIVIVANEPGKEKLIEGADVGQHLARHGLNVTVERVPAGDVDIGNVLLSHAADAGTDFLVMGGYGHSRMREFVLGGVTARILSSMTVPVLMSH